MSCVLFADASLLPAYVRVGHFADHRGNSSNPGSAAYATPFNNRVRADVHAASNADLLRAKLARREMQEAHLREAERAEEAELAAAAAAAAQPATAASSSNGPAAVAAEPHPSSGHQHQGMQLQSRADMKASLEEFMLPDGE